MTQSQTVNSHQMESCSGFNRKQESSLSMTIMNMQYLLDSSNALLNDGHIKPPYFKTKKMIFG